MKNWFGLVIATLSAFVWTSNFCEAGPRGSRGGARPSPSISRPSPQRPSRPTPSNFTPTSRDVSSRLSTGSRDLSNRNLGSRNLGDHNFSGQQRLSGILEGQAGGRTAASKQQLNDFLGIKDQDQTRLTDRQQDHADREQNWNDRQQQFNDHKQQLSDKKDDLQPKIDETKQNISDRSSEIYDNVNHYLDGQPEPFSAAWYAQHPNAWQYSHPHADAWAAASFAAVTGWVAGVATTPVNYTYNQSNVYVAGSETQPTTSTTETAEAQQLSQSTLPANSGEQWMPIGVYALVQGSETKSQMLMQISVSKSGQIGGSYYNVLSDNSQPISGSLNKQTQKVAWTVAGNQKAIFQTDLKGLTEQETPVLVHYGDGDTQQMTLVRMPDDKT